MGHLKRGRKIKRQAKKINRKRKAKANKHIAKRRYTFKTSHQSLIKIREKNKKKKFKETLI